jgi:hypothetical protein
MDYICKNHSVGHPGVPLPIPLPGAEIPLSPVGEHASFDLEDARFTDAFDGKSDFSPASGEIEPCRKRQNAA